MKKIDIIKSDDWTALYLDGVLVYENHSLSAVDLLEYLGVDYTSEWLEYPDAGLPKNLEDLKGID